MGNLSPKTDYVVKSENKIVQLDRKKGQFERLREKWLDQIYGDAEYYSWAHRAILAYLVTKYLNRKTFTAWPTIRDLAEELRAGVNTIQKALNMAKARGHLKIDRHKEKGQRYFNHVYTPILKGSRVSLGGGDAYHQGDTYTLSHTLNKNSTSCFLKDSAQEEESKGWPVGPESRKDSNPSNGESPADPLPSPKGNLEVPPLPIGKFAGKSKSLTEALARFEVGVHHARKKA